MYNWIFPPWIAVIVLRYVGTHMYSIGYCNEDGVVQGKGNDYILLYYVITPNLSFASLHKNKQTTSLFPSAWFTLSSVGAFF